MLLLNVPDAGEQALATGFMFDGIATKEALEVEQPMFQELGFMEAIQDKKALTASINWYRYCFSICSLQNSCCKKPYVSSRL